MIHFDLPKQKSSIIKVIGVGGGGSNAVNFMFNQDVEGVDFIVCNTDAKAIEQSKVPNKIQLGPFLTQGLGAGADPEVGKKATEESLDEIKKILEVNTKMAFITVGMGGGTGTGGAPIIAQICKDLGILTVGIVTTPFGFEGPRRLAQAQKGINELTPHVDTLLVISNDKLRMQYGNLKMKEAFGKADNVLATAAKCITDIINSKGHIIVDFADVCTVMKNGGVAILGKSEAAGENRAQEAIEEALASPLLNDSDIKGAKWILININSAEGDFECTMDESETILSYLRMQAGEDTDVIVGMGYDNTLEDKIGITLVATGFQSKNPFAKPVKAVVAAPVPEKIVMPLAMFTDEVIANKPVVAEIPVVEEKPTPVVEDVYLPTLTEIEEEKSGVNIFPSFNQYTPKTETVEIEEEITHLTLETPTAEYLKPVVEKEEVKEEENEFKFFFSEKPVASSIASKPTNIYASSNPTASNNNEQTEEPIKENNNSVIEFSLFDKEEEIVFDTYPAFDMVEKPVEPIVHTPVTSAQFEDLSEAEIQRKKAQDRISKLRNLSFDINSSDTNSDFDSVPAYIRQKMDLFGNALTTAENFYSKYTVNKEPNTNAHLSTINAFLDGKKPD